VSLTYRHEIDGLRAVAVIPVILFHAGFTIFSGGYVGVDVFFVISGYLITSIVISELQDGNFSIARFYERRARRILPALFFVILCCLPFAWMWMLPAELKAFSQSIVAVVFFASNILFWREEGYFAPSAELKPLLHTWSLAVEEQYYLLFPVFLLLTWRFGLSRVFWMIAATAAFSLLLSEWGWRYAPGANFYLAPTRAWELLAGSMCAFWLSVRAPRTSNTLSLAGLALILFAIFQFDDTTPFPSIYALAPVAGAALIILFGGTGTWTARLLSTRGFVGIGLVSYSAYLWHQPLFAFARIRSIAEPAPELMTGLAALSLGLAYLSWRFVEQPFRKGRESILPTRRSVFAYSGAAAAVFVAIGVGGHLSDGAASRPAPVGITFQDALKAGRIDPNYGLSSDCEGRFTLSVKCRTSAAPEAILWGDSYAMHLAPSLAASPSELSFIQHTKSQCSPIVDISLIGDITPWRDCLAFNDQVLDYIKNNTSAKYVIVSSPYAIIEPNIDIYFRDGRVESRDQYKIVLEKIEKTNRLIESFGKQMIIVSPTPRSGTDIGQCLLRAATFGDPSSVCDFDRAESLAKFGKQYRLLKEVSKFAPVVWLDDLICTDETCHAMLDNTFVYRDTGHLSIEGGRHLGRKFDLAGQVIRVAGQHVQGQNRVMAVR
jgi:peptidoglycan/LPS O-acetylase OafA/YrhL